MALGQAAKAPARTPAAGSRLAPSALCSCGFQRKSFQLTCSLTVSREFVLKHCNFCAELSENYWSASWEADRKIEARVLLPCRSPFTTIKDCMLIVKLLAACLLHDSEAGEDLGWDERWWHRFIWGRERENGLQGNDPAAWLPWAGAVCWAAKPLHREYRVPKRRLCIVSL